MSVQMTGFNDYDLERRRPDYHIVLTGDRFEQMIRFLESSKILVFDTETSGLEWFRESRICGVALAGTVDGQTHHFYTPFRHCTGEAQLDIERVSPDIRKLLAGPQLKIGHHLKFDKHMANREGWVVAAPWYDTMIAAKLYDENRYVALKTRAVEDLGESQAKVGEGRVDEMVHRLAKQQRMGVEAYRAQYGYSQVPIWLLGEYACGDTEFTNRLHIFYEQTHRSISQRYARIWNTEMDLLDVICDMEEQGIAIDVEYLSKLRLRLQLELQRVEAEITVLLGGRKLELGSDAVIRKLLLEDLGCRLQKMTRGGAKGTAKQFAVDKEVLADFSHVHPAIERILAWREAEKLANTYTLSILDRLDSRNYLHPDFQQMGTTSGRLSCKSPNFQNQPVDDDDRAKKHSGKSLEEGGTDPWSIRRSYVVGRPGWVRLFFDYCLAPETLVETVAGKRALGDLHAGDKVYTYRDGKIAWGEVTRSARVGRLPSYRVSFDNGESVVASADHRWPIRVRKPGKGGPLATEIRPTSELQVGDRMIPMKRVRANYVHLYSRGATLYTKEHLLVAEAVLGSRPAGHVVHHINGNKENNHFSNLEYVLRQKHDSDHGRSNYKKQDHGKRMAALRVGLANRRSYDGVGNPNFGKLQGKPVECACCGKGFYRPPSRVPKFCSRKCYFQAKRNGNNHRVVAIEFLGDREMAAITVEPDHNFVLGCGVVTLNSQIELRVLAYYTKDPILVAAYMNGEDIHTRTSIEVFGTAEKAMRRLAKVINFGLCISEGQRVLTQQDGLVPIERVQDHHLLWDGVEWVKHDGLVCRGVEEVLTYDGITATPDHVVYLRDGGAATLRDAASAIYSRRLAVGAIGETPVRFVSVDRAGGKDSSGRWEAASGGGVAVRELRGDQMVFGRQCSRWSFFLRLSEGEIPRQARRYFGWALRCYGAALRAGYARFLEELQGAGDQGSVQVTGAFCPVGFEEVSRIGFPGIGLRSHRQRWGLLFRKSATGDSFGEFAQSQKAKVYDLINAGPRHRFTVEGRVVSNSYGLSPVGFARQVHVSREEAESYFNKFFERYHGIVDFRDTFWAQVRRQKGYFQNLFGRPRRVQGMNISDNFERGKAEREAIASLIQGTAAELTKESLVRIAHYLKDRALPAKLISTVHDEIQLDCAAEVLPEVAIAVKRLMEDYSEFSPIPIRVDGDYTVRSWSDKTKLPKA